MPKSRIKEDLMTGINAFFSQDASAGLSKTHYMELYTCVYNFCTNTADNQDTLAAGSRGSMASAASELYLCLRHFLENHMANLLSGMKDLLAEDLLLHYTQCWETYRLRIHVLDGICGYLNRHWIKREVEEGHRDIFDIYHTGLYAWVCGMFCPLSVQLTEAALSLIARERHGETVKNIHLVPLLVRCMVEIGSIKSFDRDADTQGTEQCHLYFYRRYFELYFIAETQQFYNLECADFLFHNPVSRYVRRVEQRIQEEKKRVNLYLHPSTEIPLIECCEKIMISRYIEQLRLEFQALLQKTSSNDVTEELRRIYQIVVRVPKHIKLFTDLLEEQVIQEGNAEIEKQDADVSPITYVQALLRVYKRFSTTIAEAFLNNGAFAASLDKACKQFVNDNAVTRAAPTHQSKSPELLARYCDVILRKGPKSSEDDDIEDMLNEVMIIFAYVEDKDVFQKFYANMLARRLVAGLLTNDDAEAAMISKLKQACGFEYTSKLQRMFQDMDLSKSLNEGFREWNTRDEEKSNGVDFSILVLSSGCWPYQISVQEFIVPTELQNPIQRFTQFYTTQHSGRKLIWMHSLSRGELVTNCFSMRYTLQTSTFQMGVLLQFNDQLSWTVTQLMESTGISQDVLIQVIRSLIKAKLLVVDDTDDSIELETTVNLSSVYHNRKVVVNINLPTKGQLTKAEQEKTHCNIDEDRRVLIQAAIVRIVKTRRTIKHHQLVAEVLEFFSSQFHPDVHTIKKCIDILIEKEYLERSETEKDTYNYLA
ncbi:cullin-1-like [Schistocerca americana]|uniref:cullin-1-like n=1 Tax=Schistocerca americana TaxID=7009 RepID=UPI001F4F8F73|nr:cullin-1-like [Schistocerca americana]